ncbi:MAG: FeoB-associated Cys-rich membrane protein [Oscillospiraceae bacterium]|nr:FeoB-associated Cys-rich membrane protein [Oscillospiraceae bacterium]
MDIVLLVLIAAALVWAVADIIRQHRNTRGCGYCGGCHGCDGIHKCTACRSDRLKSD